MAKFLGLAAALLPAAAMAQVVGDCDGKAHALWIAEPWEENTATFANGAVRVTVLDTIEPGAVPLHLMIFTPPVDELGVPYCWIVSWQKGIGFSGLEFGALEAAYDPAEGLVLQMPAQMFDGETGGFAPLVLTVTVNQATGAVGAWAEPDAE